MSGIWNGENMVNIVKKYKNSIVYTWLISYAAILLIPVIGFSSVYFASVRTAVGQLEKYNNMLMDSVIASFDEKLSENTKIVNFIDNSQSVNYAMDMEDTSHNEYFRCLEQVQNEIKAYISNMGIKDRFYIYFKNSDMIVSTNEIVNSYEFYNNYYRKTGFAYANWQDKISYVSEPFCTIGGNNDRFFYRAAIPISSKYDKKAVLVVETKRSDLISQLGNQNGFNFEFAVFGTKKELIVATDGISENGLKTLHSISKNGLYSVDGTKYMVRVHSSSSQDYIGICLTTHKSIVERIRILETIYIGVMILVILFGIYFIKKSIKRNYLPLEKILASTGEHFSENSNEYDIIYKAIKRMKTDNRGLENVLDRQKEQLRNNYLCRCMKYKMADESFESRNRYGIEFAGDNFIVLLFHFENYNEFFENEADINDEEKFDVIMDLMKNVMEEVAQMNGVSSDIVEIDGTTTMLLSFKDNLREAALDTALQIAAFGREFFMSQLKVCFKTAVSDLHSGISGISTAYHQAVNIMEYNMDLNNEPVLTSKSMPEEENGYRYNFEIEQKFMNLIKTGNAQDANNIVENVFKNFANGIDADSEAVQIYDMIGTLLKIKQDCGCNSVEIPTKWDDIGQLKEALKESVSEMCEFCSGQKNTQIKELVEEYVNEHYKDVNLGVAQIAEGLRMNRSYLSTMFKNQSGVGVLEYISKYRLEKAKELLTDGELTVEQVSAEVGYSEPRTLRRIFKKYEGVTPLQYSKMNKNEDEN